MAIPAAVPLTIEEVESPYMNHADTCTQEFEKSIRTDEERLRYLINVGKLFTPLEASVYTYSLSPEKMLVFTQDGIAEIVFAELKDKSLLMKDYRKKIFEAVQIMIVATLDSKNLSLQNYLKGIRNLQKDINS